MRLREFVKCDPGASCLMFFKICRSSTADEDAHGSSRRSVDSSRRAMPSLRNAFHQNPKHHRDPSNKARNKASKGSRNREPPGRNKGGAGTGGGRTGARREFVKVTTQGLGIEEFYSNPENLPSLEVAYQSFKQVYPRFKETVAVDVLREREYENLGEGDHVCFDYSGFGLFSHRQQVFQRDSASFNLAYISANLPTHALYGTAEEGTVEAYIRRRIMNYMNLSDSDYSMVFTASRGTAYKLLAESYPFNVNNRLLTVYDYESDAVSWMAATAKEKGAKIMNASFKWPNLKISAPDLRYKLQDKKKKKDQTAKGLFVFPVQSRVTGAKYSYQWMSQAQANKWHVLLDASALAPKDMDSLALSLFRPEFIVTSFYKVFGADPTGFGCLFIKNSIIQGLHNSDRARGVGMVRIIPAGVPNSSLPRDEGQRGSQERLPDIHETETEEYFQDAPDYVDPVSAFSGPMAQYYVDSVREMAVIDRITSSGREMNIAGFDDSSGRTSLPSENEEDWDDRLHGESAHSGVSTRSGPTNEEEQSASQDPGNLSEKDSGTFEIEEEPIFPLTRRAEMLGLETKTLSKESDARSPPNEEVFSFNVGREPDIEIFEDDEDDEILRLDEALAIRGDKIRSLSRIREDEPEEFEDGSPLHLALNPRGDSPEALGDIIGGNGSHVMGSPLFHSPDGFTGELEEGVLQGLHGDQNEEALEEALTPDYKRKLGKEVEARSEADIIESNIMFRDDRDFALREGRDVDSFLSAEIEDSNGGHFVGSSGANGRRLQSWSPGEGTDEWEAQYVMSEGEGSPMYLDDEGPVVCHGLDHADSQGLNRTNLRLRFLINWLIHALLKLRHPAQLDTQGTNLVHIYGPEVHFDRGHALAFNLFDWNGVPVRAELVQRLADRNNISLGLGTLCNIVYPEGPTDLAGLWFNKSAEGGNNDGKADPPRASNASKHERPSEIPVVTAALGFVSTFGDVYRLWAFVAKFLDADFVKREEWLYHSLNQEIHVL